MSILRLSTIILSLTLLVACGGGGGVAGGGTGGVITPPPVNPPPVTPPPSLEDLPNALVNPTEARNMFSGSTELNADSGQIQTTLVSRASNENSDSALFGIVNLSTPNEHIPVSCSGRNCTAILARHSTGDSTLTFSPDILTRDPRFNGMPFPGFNQQYEAVMSYRGVDIAQAQSAGRFPDSTSTHHSQNYLGWLDGSVFGVNIGKNFNQDNEGYLLSSYSFGNDSGSNPTSIGQQGKEGRETSATWNGIMVGANRMRHVVQGDVVIDIDDFSSPNIDVSFTGILNLNDTSDTISDMIWRNLTLTGGAFDNQGDTIAANGSIEGVFYGTDHEEVGGVFTRNDIVGSFGGVRQQLELEDLPDALVSAAEATSARNLFSGSTELNADLRMIKTTLESRASNENSDSSLFASYLKFSSSSEARVATNNCNGRDCTSSVTVSARGQTFTFTRNFSPHNLTRVPLSNEDPLPRFNQQYEPVMTYRGVDIVQAQSAGRPRDDLTYRYQNYGAWLNGSVFGVERHTQTFASGTEYTWISSYSFGDAIGSNPSAML